MAVIEWYKAKEPGNAEVLARPLRQILEASGYNPDADFAGFKGLATATSAADRDLQFPAPVIGQLVLRTDTKTIERHTGGGVWDPATAPGESIQVFADAAARTASIPTPIVDQKTLQTDSKSLDRWNGASWVTDIANPIVFSTLAARDAGLSKLRDGQRVFTKETGESHFWDNGTSSLILISARPKQIINAKSKGAIGDDSGITIAAYNALNGSAANFRRSDWVGVYSDNDSMDYAGLQEAYYAAFGNPGAEHSNGAALQNYALYIPGGRYRCTNWLGWNRTLAARIFGDGRFTTQIWIDKANRPVVRTNGFSYSQVTDIGFFASVDNPLDVNQLRPARRMRGVLFELDWDTRTGAQTGLADTAVASATNPGLGPVEAVAWTTNQFAGKYLWLVAGTGGAGDVNASSPYGTYWKITSNTANRLTIDNKWTVAIPDGTTKFVITDTPVNRINGEPYARGVVGDTSQGGAAPTATTLPKMANGTSYWGPVGPWGKRGWDSRLWSVNQHQNKWVLLTSGAGAGQYRQISSNTDRVLTVTPAWTTMPSAYDGYVILPNAPTGASADTPFTCDVAKVTDATLQVAGTPTWTLSQFGEQELWVVSGTGKGQKIIVGGNTVGGLLTMNETWDTLPDATSTIRIIAKVGWSATLQADEFVNCEFTAEGHNVGAGTRTVMHGDGGQGSEMHFRNCFWNWFRNANHINLGFNALQNTFISGDFQSYTGHGWWVESGAIQAYDVGLQTDRLGALYNNGYDIYIANAANDHSIIEGCRSEGYLSFNVAATHSLSAIGYASNAFPPSVWAANNQYNVGDIIFPPDTAPYMNRAFPMVCIAAVGDRRSGATMPTDFNVFAAGQEIIDNNVIWSPYTVNSVQGEHIHAQDCMFSIGRILLISGIATGMYLDNIVVGRPDWLEIAGGTQSPDGLLFTRAVHVHLRGGPNDQPTAKPYTISGSTSRYFKSADMIGGGHGLVFLGGVRASGAQCSPPVGLRRGDWSDSTTANAILGVIGVLGRESPVDHFTGGEQAAPSYLANTKGEDQIIAGGKSTGDASVANANDTTGDGNIRLQTAPPGAAGATGNAFVDRVTIDKYGVLTTKFGKVISVTAVQSVADAGNYTPDAGIKETHRINMDGDITINAPTWNGSATIPDGAVLELELRNLNATAKTPVLNAVFKAGTVPAIGTNKRITARFRYALDTTSWYLIGAFSPNL